MILFIRDNVLSIREAPMGWEHRCGKAVSVEREWWRIGLDSRGADILRSAYGYVGRLVGWRYSMVARASRKRTKATAVRQALLGLSVMVAVVAGLLTLPRTSTASLSCPGPIFVDSSGGGDYTTIQAAVNVLTDPGPCTIIVKIGTTGIYNESVSISSRNTTASLESQRIVIAAAFLGTVTVTPSAGNHAFTLIKSKFITIKGFNLVGATVSAIFLDGGSNTNRRITIDSNDIHGSGSNSAGVGIASGNDNTWVVNNLIRNNGENGIGLGVTGSTSSGNPKYIVNNTIYQNGNNGITTPAQEDLFVINNLIVGNGTASGSTNGRFGLNTFNTAAPQRQVLINNMFYKNGGTTKCGVGTSFCDIDLNALNVADSPSLGDPGDSGNYTTNGNDIVPGSVTTGITGCTFASCDGTHADTEIFVNPATPDFHLKTTSPISPAIDKGVNSFLHPLLSVSVPVTFTSATKTITRSSGSNNFLTNGFLIGQTITTTNLSNPGPFTITNVTATVITVAESVVAAGAATTTITTVPREWVPTVDFEGTGRPTNGGMSLTTDMGYDEALFVLSAVRLTDLTATAHEEGVLLEWRTGFEVDNLGFHLYREEGGQSVRLTPSVVAGSALLAGEGTRMTAGNAYSWVDVDGMAGDRYRLEDVDLNGQSTWHGPVEAQWAAGGGHLSALAPSRQAKLLSQLGRRESEPDAGSATRPVQPRATLPAGNSTQLGVQWALAAGPAVKLGIREEGWYRVGRSELVAAGLDPKAKANLLQLFVDGQEQPLVVKGAKDGRFGPGATIEFYGVGLDTPSTDTRTYWLVVGTKSGRRVSSAKSKSKSASGADSFPFTVERKDRLVYFPAARNGEAENFFGAVIATSPVEQVLSLSHLDPSPPGQATLEVTLQGVTAKSHQVQILLNGAEVGVVEFAGKAQGILQVSVDQTALQEGDNLVTLVPEGGPGDVSIVDAIRLTYWHTYSADQDALRFTASGGQSVRIDGFTSSQIQVLDVTDPKAVQKLTGSVKSLGGGYAVTVAVPGSGTQTLWAFTEARVASPATLTANQPSTWHQAGPGADLVIIAHETLLESVGPLKALREGQGYSVAVIDVEDLYNEFSYGHKNPWALKDFLSRAGTQWQRPPRFVLLVGDASLDPRNYLGHGDFDFVPTKLVDTASLETASDDWIADFVGDGIPTLAVGRLPVRTAEEAAAVVAKLLSYEQAGGGHGVVLVSGINSNFDFDGASGQLRALIPSGISVQEIHRGGTDGATAKQELIDSINHGPQLVNYAGHGSVDLWGAGLLTAADASALSNSQPLPVFVSMTCLNGYFVDPVLESLAEALLNDPQGGAVAAWASSGLTDPEWQFLMDQALFQRLFTTSSSGQSLTLGEVMVQAKAAVPDRDIRRTWILFGDPSMRLK